MDVSKEYRQKGYHALPDVRARRKLYRELNPERSLFDGVKNRSRKRGWDFDITVDDIIIPEICPILLIPLEKYHPNRAPSLDRIDNLKGYIKGNVRVISKRANSLKGDMSIEDIERLLAYAKGEL
jgi:hypothetical protein